MIIPRKIKKVLGFIISYFARLVPLQNIVILNSFQGKGMADDPKYIAMELLRRKENVRLMWLLNNVENVVLPIGIEALKMGSLKACFYKSIARVWIDNCRGFSNDVIKRKGQYYIQTWHSILGLKKLGSDNTKSSIKARKHVKRDMQNVDLMYSNSDYRVNKYKTTFWYNGPVLKCDIPKVAFIKNPPIETRYNLYKKLGLDEHVKIAMYAPTFRDKNKDEFDAYNYNFERIIEVLNTRFGGDFVMLIRLHPNLRNSPVIENFAFNDRILDVTSMPDMEELLCITDILFTDFSSSMFDYSIAGKPVILIAKDYKHYISVDRELYFDPKKDLPFEFCETEDDLIIAIQQFNHTEYYNKCAAFYANLGLEDSGRGDKVLADIVMSQMRF